MSQELNTTQLLEYVKKTVELESSCYSQSKAIDDCRNQRSIIEAKQPVQNALSVPTKKTVDLKKPPTPRRKFPVHPLIFVSLGLLILVGLPLLIGFFGSKNTSQLVVSIFLIITGIVLLILGISNSKKNQRRNKDVLAKYNEELAQYERQYSEQSKIIQKEYDHEMEIYNDAVQRNREIYDFRYRQYLDTCENAKNAVAEMEKVYADTQQLLQSVYDIDVIFPKYRNLVAVTTILEYLESGRCTELTGPNGAYNLYEMELRQNLIINRLEMAVTLLEDIKANQYTLYTEMQKANSISTYMASQIKDMAESTKRIEANSAVTAYCSQITAANTECLKWMTLYQSL